MVFVPSYELAISISNDVLYLSEIGLENSVQPAIQKCIFLFIFWCETLTLDEWSYKYWIISKVEILKKMVSYDLQKKIYSYHRKLSWLVQKWVTSPIDFLHYDIDLMHIHVIICFINSYLFHWIITFSLYWELIYTFIHGKFIKYCKVYFLT